MRCYIGIDNGTSGSVGFIRNTVAGYFKTPTKNELSYTKVEKRINRIDAEALFSSLTKARETFNEFDCMVAIERPFVNPQMWTASLSAIRALEATLCVLERLHLPYRYIDSKEWQRAMLPSGIVGTDKLKAASLDVARRIYPQIVSDNPKAKDMDGLLIAAYLKKTNA